MLSGDQRTRLTGRMLDKIGSAEADVPHQIFLGTLVQAVLIAVVSLIGGRLSDRPGRRKVFILIASVVYGVAMFVIAIASNFNGFVVRMAIGGLGFGIYLALRSGSAPILSRG